MGGPCLRPLSPSGCGGFVPSQISSSKAPHSPSGQHQAALPISCDPFPLTASHTALIQGIPDSVGHMWDPLPPPHQQHADLWEGDQAAASLLQPPGPTLPRFPMPHGFWPFVNPFSCLSPTRVACSLCTNSNFNTPQSLRAGRARGKCQQSVGERRDPQEVAEEPCLQGDHGSGSKEAGPAGCPRLRRGGPGSRRAAGVPSLSVCLA